MKQLKVFIVIPNWNGQKFLADCLDSVFKINYPDYRIIVVDNGSDDGSTELVKNNYPKLLLIENEKNFGFAAACNQGIEKGLAEGADYVLLLNNDTIVSPDFLKEMVKAGEKEENVGIVGPKIYYSEDRKKIWFAGGRFVRWRASGKHLFWQEKETGKMKGTVPSDFITGCAMLIKKRVFDDIGYFYEPYFLTIEDLDFCLRARKAGWKTVVNLDACLWHRVSASRKGEYSFSNGYYGVRNRLFFAFQRTHNFLAGLVLLFCIIPARIVQWSCSGKFRLVKGLIFGTRDFFRGKMGSKE